MEFLEKSIPVGEPQLFQKTLDALLSHIAILSEEGEILAVNAAWKRFGRANGLADDVCGPGTNYLQTCDRSAVANSRDAKLVAQGIRDVITGRMETFSLEYPCHSPTERRWFTVRVTGFEVNGVARIVVSHDIITQRKLAEIKVRKANRQLSIQAGTDGLTGLANRRIFDRELALAWGRFVRSGGTFSVLLIDVDCFKQFNDNAGHLAGDDCLKAVARAIRSTLASSGGLAARYGGEEFAVLLPRADEAKTAEVAGAILEAVRGMAIPHPLSRVHRKMVTVSIGGSSASPGRDESSTSLLLRADRALYVAKARGRDRAVSASSIERNASA